MPLDRLTPSQRRVLRLLQDGWQCCTGGSTPPVFHKLLSYGFHQGEVTRWVSGTTLRSLVQCQLIAWTPGELALVCDHSRIPGYALTLTPEAHAWLEHHASACAQEE